MKKPTVFHTDDWIKITKKHFGKNVKSIFFDNDRGEFKLDYFNSTSAKFILDIFMKLQTFRKDEINIKVKWHYAKPDLDMKESGEEFAEMTGIPFEYIAT